MAGWLDGCHKGAATTSGTTHKIRGVKEEEEGAMDGLDGRTAAEKRKERHLVQGGTRLEHGGNRHRNGLISTWRHMAERICRPD